MTILPLYLIKFTIYGIFPPFHAEFRIWIALDESDEDANKFVDLLFSRRTPPPSASRSLEIDVEPASSGILEQMD